MFQLNESESNGNVSNSEVHIYVYKVFCEILPDFAVMKFIYSLTQC